MRWNNRHELIAGDIQTQYAVCAPTGEPLALFDTAGHRVWRQPPQSLYGLRLGVLGENAELNPGLQFAGQWLDEESGLVYNRFRYYSPVAGCYLTPDPIGLAGGANPYAYVPNPTNWIDPLGLNSKKCQYVYRELSVEDRIRFDAGLSIQPKGAGGTIAAHVDGKPTGFVSVAEVRDATERFSSGSGLVRIDVKKATQNGATYIPHKNVMQTVNSQGSLQNRKDAKRAVEGLFKGEIPHKAIELIK
ncbi:RHS repeat-associated core domain-containing protein [Xenorhabdus bovienii]|uniref:RHS repeat-associated core domain-containing protein n=1 Tax=Xenorhabdus bovienii TaxID=40576 RepID=UPI0023B32FA1|nr:RHS repeat-associated core domain-containing protein [Xenorhabdus bovienii]MDE9545532.1 RHS repeat-associated core domain-containing protein [Xenorhabdus bovienii]